MKYESKWVLPLAAGATFFLVLGLKLWLIAVLASPVPFWDQWKAEAAQLYSPYLSGGLNLHSWIGAENEHRILLTRVLALVLFELRGEWDPLLQMCVNAGLHALFAALLVVVLNRLAPGSALVIAAFATLVFGLPIGWENTLAGFQSQFYLLLLFSFAAILTLSGARAFSAAWWGGVVLAILSYLSMASGALTPFAAAAIIALQLLTRQRGGRREWAGLAALAALGVVLYLTVPVIAGHEPLKAHNLGEFLSALFSIASLPLFVYPAAVLVHFPLLLLAFSVIRTPPALHHRTWVLLGCALWVAAQMLSLAHGRAAIVMSSRYLDLVVVALPLNLVALLWLLRGEMHGRLGALTRFVPAAWLLVITVSLCGAAYLGSWREAVGRSGAAVAQKTNVVAFLASNDESHLRNKDRLAIPYPSADYLIPLLRDPTIRQYLPTEIRPANADISALHQRLVTKGRFAGVMAAARNAARGYWWLFCGLGLGLLLASGYLSGRSSQPPAAARDGLAPAAPQ